MAALILPTQLATVQWHEEIWIEHSGEKHLFRTGQIRPQSPAEPMPPWCWWVDRCVVGGYPNREAARRMACIRLRAIQPTLDNGQVPRSPYASKQKRHPYKLVAIDLPFTLEQYHGVRGSAVMRTRLRKNMNKIET